MTICQNKPFGLIPARGGSKRHPCKNIALLGGKPVLAWTLEAAQASGVFDDIWASSEEEEILRVAERWGGRPPLRSPDLAEDGVTVVELCLSVIRQLALQRPTYPALYVLLPTSPFRRSEMIGRAWRVFCESGADALMSVAPLEHPPQWALIETGNWLRPLFPEAYESPRQAFAQAYRHDGGHAIAKIEELLKTESFLTPRTLAFPVEAEEAVDINEPEDMTWAEYLLGKRQRR